MWAAMDKISEIWLEKFREAIAYEIAKSPKQKESDAYRAMEAKTGIAYDYIYQIYKGKPETKPKLPTRDVMEKVLESYKDVISPIPGESNDGTHQAQAPQRSYRHTAQANELAALFDLIPEANKIARAKAYANASHAILDQLQPTTVPVTQGTETQAA